ncbi:MAG: sulfur carrier protein ThiS [Campylobacterales bacterium]
MIVEVNGEKLETNSKTIEELIDELKLQDRVMGVALNTNIVKKENWSTQKIEDNDKLELLSFVGGG